MTTRYGRLSYEAFIGALSPEAERQEERDRARYDAMLDDRQPEADRRFRDEVMGLLDDLGISYDVSALCRMVSVERLFAAPQHTDAGRVREAIARLTDTPRLETWIETQDGGAR